MKRALFQNVTIAPYNTGAVIDRNNFLSAIVAAAVAEPGDLILTVTHSDTETGTFEPAADMRLEANDKGTFTVDGKITVPDLSEGDLANVEIDLVGCKRFIKIAAAGEAAEDAALAYALGDAQYTPV